MESKAIELRTPTTDEITAIKADLKASNISSTVRIEKGIRRSFGTISIKARGRGFYTLAETEAVAQILEAHGIFVDRDESAGVLAYQPGFWYMWVRS